MKLVLFDDDRPGVLTEAGVVDISSAVPVGRSGQETVEGIMESWPGIKPEIDRLVGQENPKALGSVGLRAPVPRPGKIMCMAANFREGLDAPPLPFNGFIASPDAVLGPGETTVLPAQPFNICHHEAELVCVIGKAGREVSKAQAMDHVFGYTAGVDVSARAHWGFLGKTFDGFKPIGPCIVTADEIADPHALRVRLSVDGQARQDYSTSDMGHPIPECIEWFSSLMTIRPGDLLFVGTNHQQLGPLQDGETAVMAIDGIGEFSFSIRDPMKRSWPKDIDANVGQGVRSRIEEHARTTTGPAGR